MQTNPRPECAPSPGAALEAQVSVLDAGGQYSHMIARKVRELGVYADVVPSEKPAGELRSRRGLIISGGPSSVYDPDSPTVDPGIFRDGPPVLGICYGQQLMARLLGGAVQKGEKGEYGLAYLEVTGAGAPFGNLPERQAVWMSHRDLVARPPKGFSVLGRTATCAVAAMGDARRRLYGVQFHPEVAHTRHGREILANFLFGVCGCERDWDPRGRVPLLEAQIRDFVGLRNVFFFVSGGVDSTVAFTLCLRALGRARVHGTYVDTGLMREGETEFVHRMFGELGPGTVAIQRAEDRFLTPLSGVTDPERKRQIIGEEFVRVQEDILETGHYLEGDWILGQGTIYPDTIESGGTAKAAVIKTHHNRVPEIQKLIEAGCVVEPLSTFYKDEVREIGRELGLPEQLLERHPFPGPGLAIRCLCSDKEGAFQATAEGWIVPVHSVGVQGDSRSYAPILALDECPGGDARLQERATELINRMAGINRVVARVASIAPLDRFRVTCGSLSRERLARLRRADSIVRRLSQESGFDRQVWQFPVILIPVGAADRPDSIVLRPVDSVDGMTASSVLMGPELLRRMAAELLEGSGVGAVFYDLTHKPPGTIEWE